MRTKNEKVDIFAYSYNLYIIFSIFNNILF